MSKRNASKPQPHGRGMRQKRRLAAPTPASGKRLTPDEDVRLKEAIRRLKSHGAG